MAEINLKKYIDRLPSLQDPKAKQILQDLIIELEEKMKEIDASQ